MSACVSPAFCLFRHGEWEWDATTMRVVIAWEGIRVTVSLPFPEDLQYFVGLQDELQRIGWRLPANGRLMRYMDAYLAEVRFDRLDVVELHWVSARSERGATT